MLDGRERKLGGFAIFAAIRSASSLVSSLAAMSALPPKVDIGTQSRDVRFVPKADIYCEASIAALIRPARLALVNKS